MAHIPHTGGGTCAPGRWTGLLLAALLTSGATAAAPTGLPPPTNAFIDWAPSWSRYDAAALDVPPPPPPLAAAGVRYLLLPLPMGTDSHSHVLRRVGAELASRGAHVLALQTTTLAHLMKPPADAAGAARWTVRAYNESDRMPALMAKYATQKWRAAHINLQLGPALDVMGHHCDILLADEGVRAAVAAFRPTFIVGDVLNPCVPVVSELLRVPRAEIGVGSLIDHMHSAPWRGSGRDWPLDMDPAGVPAGGTTNVPPLGVRAIAANAAWRAVAAVLDVLSLRPPIVALVTRHGVDLTRPAARARSALLVVNADAAWEHARRLPPGVVLAGSLLAGPGEPLPPEEAAWLAAAAARGDHVVYFALGTMFRMGPGAALDLVGRLVATPRVAVLAKLTAEEAPDDAVVALPADRTRIVRWAPQNDLLASGAVSLFVTHGGASSIGEAVYHGVPIVIAPQGAEQVDNAVKVAAAGFGVALPSHQPSVTAIAAAVMRALQHLPQLTDRARAAQARARVGRPPAVAVAAAAIERAALLGEGARTPLPRELVHVSMVDVGVPVAVVVGVVVVTRRWRLGRMTGGGGGGGQARKS